MTMTAQRASDAATGAAPAILQKTLKVAPLTCSIGAEVSNVDLGAASRDPELMEAIRALLLTHKVLFFRDQDLTRGEHVGVRAPFRRAGRSSGGRQRSGSSRPGAYLQVARRAE